MFRVETSRGGGIAKLMECSADAVLCLRGFAPFFRKEKVAFLLVYKSHELVVVSGSAILAFWPL